MRTEIALGASAALIWHGAPVIAAAGCDAVRTTTVTLAEGSRVLLGERIVLGRAEEVPGRLVNRQRITLGGRVALDERLDTGDLATVRSPIVAGRSARMLAALTLIGERAPAEADVMQLHLKGSVWRAVGGSHIVTAAMLGLADSWRSQSASSALKSAVTSAAW